MNTSIDMVRVDGKQHGANESSKRTESHAELKGFRLHIPTPLGTASLQIDEYAGSSGVKDFGSVHYCQDGATHRDVEANPQTVAEGYKFAGLIITTLSSQIVAMQSADIAARAARENQEQVMAEMKHLHQLELMKLTDELEAARHARIQASKHSS